MRSWRRSSRKNAWHLRGMGCFPSGTGYDWSSRCLIPLGSWMPYRSLSMIRRCPRSWSMDLSRYSMRSGDAYTGGRGSFPRRSGWSISSSRSLPDTTASSICLPRSWIRALRMDHVSTWCSPRSRSTDRRSPSACFRRIRLPCSS